MQESDGLKPSVHLGPLIEEPDRLTKNVVYWKDNLVLCWSSAYPSPPPSPSKLPSFTKNCMSGQDIFYNGPASITQSLLLQI